METPLIENGVLDPRWVEELTPRALQVWIDNRLHGKDIYVPGDPTRGDMPHYVIAAVFPEIEDREVRRDIQRAVRGFLEVMARNTDSSWRGEAADELLRLAQSVGDGDDALARLIANMAQEGKFNSQEKPDLHHRLLQTLVALGWNGHEAFWRKQLSMAPERYAPIVFRGMTLISLECAFALLREMSWTEDTLRDMQISLPGLLRENKPGDLVPLVQEQLPALPAEAQEMFRKVFAKRGINLSPTHGYANLEKMLHRQGAPDLFSNATATKPGLVSQE